MERQQYLRLFSITSALLVGFWLPLKMIGFHFNPTIDFSFDLLISVAAISNLYLHFNGHKKINARHWKNWLHLGVVTDLICLMPLMMIQDALFETTSISLIFLNLLSARHTWKIKSFLDEFDNLKPIVYRLVPLAMMMPLMVHLIACGWIALGSGTAGPDADKGMEYIKAIYWAMTTLTTVGYGDIAAKTPPQMLYAAITQLTGVGVFGFILSNVASLLSRLDAAREHHMDNLDQIETFMSSYDIPTQVKSQVRGYYHYMWKQHKGRLDKSLLNHLPNKLQSELNFAINKAVIERVPFMKSASNEMLEDIMLALDHRVYVPGEKVFRAGEHGDCLYMIHAGDIEILSPSGSHLATLGSGAVFGEMALISDSPRNATAISRTYTDLYVLPKADFYRIIEDYPSFKSHLEEIVIKRTSATASKVA